MTVLKLKHAPHAGTVIRCLFLWLIFLESVAVSIYYMVTLMIVFPLLMHKHLMQEQYKSPCFIYQIPTRLGNECILYVTGMKKN